MFDTAKGRKPMTNAEAKEIVKRIKGYMGDGECWSESEFMAMDKAIKALDTLDDMPSEVNTIIENQEEMDVIGYKLVDDVR